MAQPNAPTGELGGIGSLAATLAGINGRRTWGQMIQEGEHVPELRWPESVKWYERMLYTDSQVEALYLGTVMPIEQYHWALDLNGADQATAELLARDLGLPLGLPDAADEEQQLSPGLYSFSFLEHLREACLAVALGHYFFEQVGEVGPDGLWHLRKLGPRAPATIAEINVEPDGGLKSIRQEGVTVVPRGNTLFAGLSPEITVDRLVAYVWRGDARAKWLGRPWLRSLYRHWLVKDMLIRVDAINHEKAGGVPTVETDETWTGSNLQELQALAASWRVGEDSGAALPPGAKMVLKALGGSNVVESLRYHDEQMARTWQAMVMQLGQTQTGSYALSQTQAGMQDAAQQAIAKWFKGTFRDHVIRDWWANNVPPDATGQLPPYPVLVCRPRNAAVGAADDGDRALNAQRYGLASQYGIVDPQEARDELGFDGPPPEPNAPAAPQQVAARGTPPARPTGAAAGGPSPRQTGAWHHRTADVRAVAEHDLNLPERELRRNPYAQEVRAAVDFARMEKLYVDALDAVHKAFEEKWMPAHIAAVEKAIEATDGSAEALAAVRVDPVGADELVKLLTPVAQDGNAAALGELQAQGLSADAASLETLRERVEDHALAVAQQAADGVSLAASRKAVQLAGAGDAGSVATGVGEYLAGLTHMWERDQLAGAVAQAQNVGRFHAFEQVDDEATYYASELLDSATCDFCVDNDGQEYPTFADAVAAYPSGGFVDCAGGPRCRGTLVATASSEV